MIKMKLADRIVGILVSLLLTLGFISVFSDIFSKSKWEIFVLITLPLIIGSVTDKKEHKLAGLLFLASSIMLITGVLLYFSLPWTDLKLTGIIFIWGGAFVFSYGLVELGDIFRDIFKMIFKK